MPTQTITNLAQYKLRNSLISITLFCFCLLVFRAITFQSFAYLFLIWNLFLAAVPYFISNYLRNNKTSISNFKLISVLCLWLLFLPNAGYIITDFFHLKNITSAPLWLDTLILFSFSITGLIFFFISIYQFEKIIQQHFKIKTFYLTLFVIILSAFGVYLGRYLRWNSWDIITQLDVLFLDIINRILFPLKHYRTWGVTFGYGIFFSVIYFGCKDLVKSLRKINGEI